MNRRVFLLLPALLLVALVAYRPVWHGGVLWDDAEHLTPERSSSLAGLGRIWFDPGATMQYYPVAHSAFWVLNALFGHATFGYHVASVGLHALSAFLLFLVLKRLSVPGAFLAAAAFSLHPVHVESVAWISELKNTISGVFCLAAALAYLRFDDTRRKVPYAIAFLLFLLALGSKTVAASLPAALLVVFWWRRGRLAWSRDVAPLVPFFLASAAAALTTVWFERAVIGAEGADYRLTLVERCLLAGRALAFYLGKLVWPADLTFVYPRWEVSQTVWWQYLYPLGALAVLAGLWRYRVRARGPLAALLLFAGTLFPALGFFDVFPFQYSFVADHFQYLASVPILALFAAGSAMVAAHWCIPRAARGASALIVLGTLGSLTWRQSHQYADAETLYRATIERNPSCWMAYNNLATLLLRRPQPDVDGAVALLETALRLNPDNVSAHHNLGCVWLARGRFEDALREHREAVRLAPGHVDARSNLGVELQALGRLDEALENYEEAVSLDPVSLFVRRNIAGALLALGRPEEALEHLEEGARANPGSPDGYVFLGDALQESGRLEEALDAYRNALRIHPDSVRAHAQLGNVLLRAKRRDEAVEHLREAVRLAPDSAEAHLDLARGLSASKQWAEAVAEFRLALEHTSDARRPIIHNDLGAALASLGAFREAATHFERALSLKPDFADAKANLARVLALEAGDERGAR